MIVIIKVGPIAGEPLAPGGHSRPRPQQSALHSRSRSVANRDIGSGLPLVRSSMHQEPRLH